VDCWIRKSLAIVACRDRRGNVPVFPVWGPPAPAISKLVVAPAAIRPGRAGPARTWLVFVHCLDYAGVLSIEFFLRTGRLRSMGSRPDLIRSLTIRSGRTSRSPAGCGIVCG